MGTAGTRIHKTVGGNSGGATAVGKGKGQIGRLIDTQGWYDGPDFGLPEGVKTDYGDSDNYLRTRYDDDVLEVRGSNIQDSLKGTGLGTGMYIAGLQEAYSQGLGFRSDSRSLSKAAKRVWEGLRARFPAGAMERGRTPSGRYPQYTISSANLKKYAPSDWNTLRSGTPKRSTRDPNVYSGYG